MGFITAIEDLNKNLICTLGEVADINKTNKQTIEKLTRKASNMWLEMGMQRFRIMIIVQRQPAVSIKERVDKAREGGLEVVPVPELKTYGNSKGLDLHIEEEIFESDIVEFTVPPWRG